MEYSHQFIVEIVKLIKEVGLDTVLNAVVILIGVRYFLKKMDDRKCVYTDAFSSMRSEVLKEIKDIRVSISELKGEIGGFIKGFRYRGKDDEY